VAELVESVDQEGLRVRLVVDGVADGRPPPLPAEVDGAGYRIVQESLTNVVRHAGARQATVRLGYGPRSVEISIADDGQGPAASGRSGGCGGGRGLAGMRDRAAALGGTLVAGPRPGGGFEVRAVLPYPGAGGDPSTAAGQTVT
jgi:signal transduction histidine kinase